MATNTREDRAIRETLVRIRLSLGLTQAEVGEKVGEKQQVISKFERGHRRLYASQLFVYVQKAYGLSPTQFARQLEKKL